MMTRSEMIILDRRVKLLDHAQQAMRIVIHTNCRARALSTYQALRAFQCVSLETLDIHFQEREFVQFVIKAHGLDQNATIGRNMTGYRPGFQEPQCFAFGGNCFIDWAKIVQRMWRYFFQLLEVQAIWLEGSDAFIVITGCTEEFLNNGTLIGAAIHKVFARAQMERAGVAPAGKVFISWAGPYDMVAIIGQAKQKIAEQRHTAEVVVKTISKF